MCKSNVWCGKLSFIRSAICDNTTPRPCVQMHSNAQKIHYWVINIVVNEISSSQAYNTLNMRPILKIDSGMTIGKPKSIDNHWTILSRIFNTFQHFSMVANMLPVISLNIYWQYRTQNRPYKTRGWAVTGEDMTVSLWIFNTDLMVMIWPLDFTSTQICWKFYSTFS